MGRPATHRDSVQRAVGGQARRHQVLLAGLFTGIVLGIVIALHAAQHPDGQAIDRLGWYGTAVVLLIGAKLILSLLAHPVPNTAASRAFQQRAYVAAIITCRNEDLSVFTDCLNSILASTRRPDALTVIDDASADPACVQTAYRYYELFHAAGIDYSVITLSRHRGKRDGLAAGFGRCWDADIYLCIDSDTVIAPHAIENALRPFSRHRVQAVTGCVLAGNRSRNLLTRLIDLRYAYAFLGERAAYSVMGSVLCACGSLALYRGTTVRKYLDDFLHQRFLGRKCTYGDDRRLTYYCLREGQVVMAPDAVAWTLVPEHMGHFLRQQLRWSKSFFRESLWMLACVRPKRVCWWLTLVELGTWCGFTTALIYALVVRPAFTGHFTGVAYLTAVILLSYARSGHYTEADHPGLSWRDRWMTLLLAPLYGIIHMTLLLPLRVVALATLRDNRWGTRNSGTEVSAT